MKQDVKNSQAAFKKLRGTTKGIPEGIVSGIAGSVTTARREVYHSISRPRLVLHF